LLDAAAINVMRPKKSKNQDETKVALKQAKGSLVTRNGRVNSSEPAL